MHYLRSLKPYKREKLGLRRWFKLNHRIKAVENEIESIHLGFNYLLKEVKNEMQEFDETLCSMMAELTSLRASIEPPDEE